MVDDPYDFGGSDISTPTQCPLGWLCDAGRRIMRYGNFGRPGGTTRRFPTREDGAQQEFSMAGIGVPMVVQYDAGIFRVCRRVTPSTPGAHLRAGGDREGSERQNPESVVVTAGHPSGAAASILTKALEGVGIYRPRS